MFIDFMRDKSYFADLDIRRSLRNRKVINPNEQNIGLTNRS